MGSYGWLASVGCIVLQVGHLLLHFLLSFFSGMPLREQGAPRAERENEVGFGDVGICTYLYLFSDQSASFFDPTRSSFSIC